MDKIYSIKELFLTIQGEGYHTGQTTVFCRFSGCNLWNGHKETQENSICSFCDTDFIGTNGFNGGKYKINYLISKIISLWQDKYSQPFIVFTGGEPGLQVDFELVEQIKNAGFYTCIETNGTVELPNNIDWVTCSPKTKEIAVKKINELKIVYPDINPNHYYDLDCKYKWIQPNFNNKENYQKAIDFCFKHSEWKLSMQNHKFINLDNLVMLK